MLALLRDGTVKEVVYVSGRNYFWSDNEGISYDETEIIKVDHQEELPEDHFFAQHSDAFETILTVSYLDPKKWRQENATVYRNRETGILAIASKKNPWIIKSFYFNGEIFYYSVREDKLYTEDWTGLRYIETPTPLLSHWRSEDKAYCLGYMRKLYGKENTDADTNSNR